jgi:hypothetical protein
MLLSFYIRRYLNEFSSIFYMCNAHEILWRVSWYPKIAKKNIFFLLFDTFQYDFLIMQKSAFLDYEFCVGSSFG